MPSTSLYSREQKLASRISSVEAGASALRVQCVASLSEELKEYWERTRASNPDLANGCFHHQFAEAVARVRGGVEFAVLKEDGKLQGILPFQRVRSRLAHPVGGLMNDFQGLIAAANTKVDFRYLLRQMEVKRLDCHALAGQPMSSQSLRMKRVYRQLDCPFIDLSSSPEAYLQWVRQHSSTVRRQPQKSRAMIRQLGPLRLEFDCRDPQLLEKVIDWKRAKFQRTRTFDILSLDWTYNLLRELFRVRTASFKGILSILWAGDHPVSGHFGFQAERRLHYYIPSHDVQFGRYSPGTELMLQLTQSAEQNQVDQIDLGYGESDLKDRFANCKTSVQYCCIGFSPIARAINHGF